MENKNKDAKHVNKGGKTIYNNSANQVSSTPTTNLTIAPQTSYQMSNPTQPVEREVGCNQSSEKFRSQSCLKQHLRSHSGDIASGQKDYPTEDILSTQLRYWKDKLIGYEILDLITDYPRQCQMKYAGQNIYFELDGGTSMNLRKLAKELKVSLYTVLMSGYYLMLRIYSNQNDLVIGTLAANSHFSRIGKMIEIFGNISAIRIQIDSKYLLKDFIKQVGGDISESHLNQDLPFEKLVEEFAFAQDNSSRHPIFQVMFGLQNFDTNLQNQTDAETDLDDLLEPQTGKSPHNVAKFDLTTIIDDSGNVLKGLFNYSTLLYREETIHRFKETFVHILSQLSMLLDGQIKAELTTIADMSYLNAEQYHQIVHIWTATDKEYPAGKTIHRLFEEQVAKTPDNVAIVYKEVELTYRELNERANKLAIYFIKKYSIQPESFISLCLDRSEYMIIAILAVLKSGGAYVPIDPSYPDERIQYILQDTSSTLLLTNEKYQKRLRGMGSLSNAFHDCAQGGQPLSILSIDSQEFRDKSSLQPANNPDTTTTSAHLAYVLYTSGTTGKPKGVMMEHKGLVNLNESLLNRYGLGDANDREVILLFSNYVFDASVEQIIISLLNGHVLLLIPDLLWLDKEKFNDYLIANKVTHICTTPRFLVQQNFNKILSLKRIVSTGENITEQTYDMICLNDGIYMLNAYGLTEASVISVAEIRTKDDVNIGSPIYNTRCYVLADNLVPVPVGAIGELYVAGVGLARGFLNRPDLTAERFIRNPFQTDEEKILGKNAKLYKTGDLVRWLPDGNLEYIERKDLQVKIRGYRIELEEIQSVLSGYKGIKQSVALAKEHSKIANESSDHKYLVGYYVSDDKLDEEAILHYLGSKLSEYMVPTFLVHLKELPLTINGKLDRKALPDPDFTGQDNYVAPRNEIEERVIQIWAEVLGIESDKVGTYHDFFRLGGNSIISTQLVSRLREKLQLNVSVKDIFQHKSIARLYENVIRKELGNDSALSLQTEQGLLVGPVPLLPVQEWFFWRNFSAAHHWNQSFLIKTPRLDFGKLQDSLDKLVQHHDCFRLRYKKDERSNNYEQYYDGNAQVEQLRKLDIRTLGYQENSQAFQTSLQEMLTNWQANFNLTDGPMYSVGYVYGYQDGSARILFAMHHLIVDTVSWRIVSEDLRDLYYDRILDGKRSSYRQWAETVKDYPRKHQEEQSYWKNILSDYDSSRLNNLIMSESTTHSTDIELSQECTSLLLRESNKAYHTQINDLLLTALAYSLTEITGSNINHILLEAPGREEIDRSIDISRTLGWFTTIYPVRLEIVDELGTSIKFIKESLRTIPNNGLGFGPIFGYKSNALPRVSFNYLGEFGQENRETLKDNDIWQIVGEDSGISKSPKNRDNNVINFNGLIIDSRLKFTIVSKLEEKTTSNLSAIFKQQILALLSHCINNPMIEYTMSDFKDFEPYVVFNKEIITSCNLFIFPPALGGAEDYFTNIVPRLCNKRLILFNNFYDYLEKKLGKYFTRTLTYEKLADDYITYIKVIQPIGPYNFFGWSFGGILAFEISKKLINKGDCVANLIFLDTYFDHQTSKVSQLDSIVYNYTACSSTDMHNTNIILFKATKVEDIDTYYNMYKALDNAFSKEEAVELRNKAKFITENTKANNLDEVLKNHNIQVVPFNSSHHEWVDDDDVLKEICIRLEEL